jgi:hypothetical protein
MRARTGIAVAGAGAIAMLVGAPAAAGASTAGGDQEVTFTDGSGAEVTCLVNTSSNTDTGNHRADSQTAFVLAENPPDPRCLDNDLSINASWTNSHGETVQGAAFGGSSQNLTFLAFDVQSGYSAHHSIRFNDCSDACTFEVTTSPK